MEITVIPYCTHTHTHTFIGRLSRTTPVSRYQKRKPIWILLKQETVSGSGISWTICKSAPRFRQMSTPAPDHSVFFTNWMPFLPPNQQRQSTEGNSVKSQSESIRMTKDRDKADIKDSTNPCSKQFTMGHTGCRFVSCNHGDLFP